MMNKRNSVFMNLNDRFTIAYDAYFFIVICIGCYIRRSIELNLNKTENITTMRNDTSCRIIFALKILNIGCLSIMSGFMATTATTSIQTLTAQSASNFVNVISITYGANDHLPHGRGDVLNGVIGSLASQAVVGFYQHSNKYTILRLLST